MQSIQSAVVLARSSIVLARAQQTAQQPARLAIADTQSDLDAVHTLLQLCWSRQYSEVWTALAHGAQSWRPPLRPLAQALLERKRAELIGMLLSAYSTVKVGGGGRCWRKCRFRRR